VPGTCVPERKQAFVLQLSPELSSLDNTAYIRKKIQVDEIKIEQFKFSYAEQVSKFEIGIALSIF